VRTGRVEWGDLTEFRLTREALKALSCD
jgi:hypothetical protein